jgi:hypothetical protein
MAFEPDETLDFIVLGVTCEASFAMLVDALDEVRRDPGVERAMRRTRENIDAGMALHHPMKRQGGSRVKPGMTRIMIS